MYSWFSTVGNALTVVSVVLFVVCAIAAYKNLGPGRTLGMIGFGLMALAGAVGLTSTFAISIGMRTDIYMVIFTLIHTASVAGLALVLAGLFRAAKGRSAAAASALTGPGWAAPPANPAQYTTPSWPPPPGGGQPPYGGGFAQPGVPTPQSGAGGAQPGPLAQPAPMAPEATSVAPPPTGTHPGPTPSPGEAGPPPWARP